MLRSGSLATATGLVGLEFSNTLKQEGLLFRARAGLAWSATRERNRCYSICGSFRQMQQYHSRPPSWTHGSYNPLPRIEQATSRIIPFRKVDLRAAAIFGLVILCHQTCSPCNEVSVTRTAQLWTDLAAVKGTWTSAIALAIPNLLKRLNNVSCDTIRSLTAINPVRYRVTRK